MFASQPWLIAIVTTYLVGRVVAHGGHENIPEGDAVSADPIDSILWAHILLQMLAFGIVFPLGMVLGIVRSRWHVPLQTFGTLVAVPAYFLGHLHKGRQFAKNIHASFANSLMLMLAVQVGVGFYLKLHLEKGIQGKMRKYAVLTHGILGKLMPLVAWVQMLFGGITSLGFCRGDHIGQCLAHFIMGSAFIAYGILLTILLLVGQYWLRRTGRSQEFFDSSIITLWGIINTFTEHRWGTPWVKNDLQHTSMGIVWWCAGLLGIWLSRSRNGRPRRNLIPAIVILMTGWAMSAHPQELPLSTMVHTVFGYTLMGAGATRIIEISFVLKDHTAFTEPTSFQYLPPYLLYASGFLFMGATEEQMELLSDANVTHVSYILILYSIAFLLFLFVNVLLHIYFVHAFSKDDPLRNPHLAPNTEESRRPGILKRHSSTPYLDMNGNASMDMGLGSVAARKPRMPRHRGTDSQQIRDAEAFELQGLIEDDDEEQAMESKEVGIRAGANGHA